MIFGTWNIQGWQTKCPQVLDEVKRFKLDTGVLTETKRKGEGTEETPEFVHYYCEITKKQRSKAGESILVNKQLSRNIKSWKLLNKRIIQLDITWKGWNIAVIGAYVPTDNAAKRENDNFYETLRELIKQIGNRKEILLLGDLNARMGHQENNTIVGSFVENKENDNGHRLINFCEQNSLKIRNGIHKHNDTHKYTWVQPT